MGLLDDDEFARWQEQAETASSVARLAEGEGHFEWACFLAEQSAQFSIKGLLHGIGADAWGHDLTTLVSRAADALGENWSAGTEEPAARLSRHYIPARYPDAHPSGAPGAHYTSADAKQAIGDTDRLRNAVVGSWQTLRESAR